MLAKLIGSTPSLKVLNKADLADPEVTTRWLNHFESKGQKAVALAKEDTPAIRHLAIQCFDMFRKPEKKQFKLMIVGIPNVGKSTYMNILLDRKIAKTGNEPAVTKGRQEVRLNDRISIIDTPGVLWPKLDPPDCGYRLAASGAVRNTAFEFEDVALWTVACLSRRYPDLICDRYALDTADEAPALLLEQIGRIRGGLRKGGVDMTKAGEALLHDLRSGKLGRISLELPEDIPPPVQEELPVSDIKP
jgi:ribosome biogenesis GTPase A